MPDLGLTKAIRAAVRTGAKGAKVLRPAEAEIIQREAAAAAKASPEVKLPELETPTAAIEESIPPPAAPDAPRIVPEPTPPANAAPAPTPLAAAAPELEAVPPLTPDQQTQVASDAFGMERASLGDFNLEESYQPNFDVMKTTDDVKAVIARQAQANAAKITEARRGTITNEQLRHLAADLDVSEDVVRKVMERESGGVLNAETILAARQVLISSAERLKSLADKIVKHQATDMEKVQFARQVQFHNEYQAQFMGARAEAGRSLNAFGIPVGGTDFEFARIAEILGSVGDIDKVALAVSRTNSVAGVTKVVKPGFLLRSARAGTGFINRVFVNGILSGPTTHIVNILGNAFFQAMNIAELGVASGVGAVRQLAGKALYNIGGETLAAMRLGRFLTAEERVRVGEALATLHGAISATRDAFRLAWRALKEGSTLDDQVKYVDNDAPGRDITSQLPELDKPYLGAMIRGLESAIGVPTRVLGAEDDFFKMIAYRGYVERATLLHVWQQIESGAATLENAAMVARDFMENPPPEVQKAAEDWARAMTFQAPLGETGQLIQLTLRKIPIGTLIAPFIRTPVNLFKEAAARSPMAVFTQRFWRDVRAGGAARDLALTRFALGSATATYIASLVAEDRITGAGPQNPQAKMLWEKTGKRPYSIRIGNKWYSYARLEPIASVIGAVADAVEIQSYLSDNVEVATNEDVEAYKAAGAIIAGIMNNTGNKTFMKGIADFVEFMNDPTRNVKSYSQQMAVSVLLPYSSLLRSIRNTQDPYLREAWTIMDKIRDNTPGLSDRLPPRLDIFGEPREKNSGTLLGTMSPIPESRVKFDPVVQELVRVMERTHLVPATMPGKEIDGMRLTADEYADYVRIARKEPIFNGGTRTYREQLEYVMSTEVYQNATSQAQYEMLKAVQRAADEIARSPGGPLEQQNPFYAARISEWRLEQERFKRGE